MKKKLTLIILAAFILSAPLFGADGKRKGHMVDNAGLLSSGEKAELEERMAALASQYDFDLVIVTEKSIGSARPIDYADDFFDNNNYGLGSDRDGCLMLQVTESRDYWFSSSGRGIKILNAAALDKLDSDAAAFLKNGDYGGAYGAFIDNMELFLSLDAKGRSYNFFYRYNAILLAIGWAISLLAGLFTVHLWKLQMDTATGKKEADSYIIPGSLAFTRQDEMFLYSTVTKTKRESKPPSSSGGGVHTSSSGRSHGGRGGKY